MNRKKLMLWYIAPALYVLCLIPFVKFMYTPTVRNLTIAALCIAAVTVLYLVAIKINTHPEYRFTAIQAKRFHAECTKKGYTTLSSCRKNKADFIETGKSFSFPKNDVYNVLAEMYKIGEALNEKKRKEDK